METNEVTEKHASENENEFEINTGRIFSNEGDYAREGEEYLAKKCPDGLAYSLEMTIRSLLVKHIKPSISSTNSTDNYLELKYEKLASGEMAHLQMQNFKVDHFVLKLEYPIEGPRQPSRIGKPDKYFYYLFEFREPLRITKKMVDAGTFELLFAFALRQCDLSYLVQFMEYHIDHNFDGDLSHFVRYLVLIKRKFEEPLFSKGLIEATDQWIRENEASIKNSGGKKIKTYLTIDQLACLFKMLMDNGHLSDEPTRNIEGVCASFETKMVKNLSSNNLGQDFYKPTVKALDFWIDNFDKMAKRAIRLKQKIEP